VAQAYLEYLYSPEGQQIAVKHYYRPVDPKVAAEHAVRFPNLKLFTLEEVAGDWANANRVHFADGGLFDQIYAQVAKR
jgi:sulfate transport system substrate-binding protein